MSSKVISTALAIIAVCAAPAHAEVKSSPDAQDSSQPMFRFGGFGTLGVSHSSENRGDYVLDRSALDGAGRSHDWATGNDSRLGIQVFADFAPRIKAIFQAETEYDSDGTYRPHVEWANVRYAFSPDLNVRAGRIGLPTFLNSENKDVGYSYPWIHPPVEVYRQLSISHSDGVDGSYRLHIGDASNIIKAVYGRNTSDFPHSTATSKNIWGIFDTFEYGATIFRAGYQARETSTQYQSTGVTTSWARNTDLSAGASYDPGGWFLTGEWVRRESNSRRQAMYVSSGIRIEKFTPYATYARDTQASFLSATPPPTATEIQFAKNSQSTVSLGTRWDFMKKADLKLQYDRVKLSADSNGHLINVPAGTILYGGTFHVFSVTVDFIF